MPQHELSSKQLEKHVLAGTIRNPQIFADIDIRTTENDFVESVHRTLWSVLRTSLLANEKVDAVILAQKLQNLGIKFRHEINIFDYLDTFTTTQITAAATIEAAKELCKMRVRRELIENAQKEIKYVTENGAESLDKIMAETDKIHNDKIQSYVSVIEPVNIFETLEAKIEGIANNPPNENKSMMGPLMTVNRIYGSLVKPGNINLVVARSGVGKTAWGMFNLIHTAEKYDVPILNCDFSEMSEEELQFRAVCLFTEGKVSMHSLETGEWRKNGEMTKLVRHVWSRVKKIRFHYYDIGSLNPDEIVNLIRRFYYKKVGRDNHLLIHYDYFKAFDFEPHKKEYQIMGTFVQKMKNLIKNDITASLWASLQSNRVGITTNRKIEQLDDSENQNSLSDRIMQQCTHNWILRFKVMEEIQEEAERFGNMKLIDVKKRHLGKDYMDALTPVKMADGSYRNNYVNIKGHSFHFEDRGDLKTMVRTMNQMSTPEEPAENDGELL